MDIRVELYQFKHGDKAWYFTNHRKDVVHNDIIYKSVRGLDRDAIEDADIDKCEIEVTFPQNTLKNEAGDSFTRIFLNKIYLESVYVTVLELEKNETLVLFIGRVTQPKFDDNADTLTLICSTGESYLNRTILTRKFQKTCPNSIYDRFCGLNFAKWSFEVTVTEVLGLNVKYSINPTQVVDDNGQPIFNEILILDESGQPILDESGEQQYTQGDPVMETKVIHSDWLVRGLLLSKGVYTFIMSNGGGNLKLYREHVGLKAGDVVYLAPGCDQSLNTCHIKFDNAARFAGHPYMPHENPIMSQLIK